MIITYPNPCDRTRCEVWTDTGDVWEVWKEGRGWTGAQKGKPETALGAWFRWGDLIDTLNGDFEAIEERRVLRSAQNVERVRNYRARKRIENAEQRAEKRLANAEKAEFLANARRRNPPPTPEHAEKRRNQRKKSTRTKLARKEQARRWRARKREMRESGEAEFLARDPAQAPRYKMRLLANGETILVDREEGDMSLSEDAAIAAIKEELGE